MGILRESISATIWDTKYRYRQEEVVIDQTIEETWQRVASAVAMAEDQKIRKQWQSSFYQMLQDFRFLPGGRILAGAGTKHKVTLFNCFVMPIATDSISGIFDALEEGALTLQQGGGVGYDFSVLRPHGDLVKKTGLSAAGPVSFMRIWDTTCSVLLSTGARRGAMMAVLRCDHPDIEEFITAKRDPKALRHFNVSVLVSDAFMLAVKNDLTWPLVFPCEEADAKGNAVVYRQWGDAHNAVRCRVYREVNARELWHKIIHSAYQYAEPGVLFGDTINRMNNLYYCEQINATNPCGEIPLPSYGACNLGAINLTQFVTGAFTKSAAINWRLLEETVRIATRFLDNVIEVSHYPLAAQKRAAKQSRRIGVGMTGLADVFVMMGVIYGSQASIDLASEIMKKIAYATWYTSIDLAKERGVFPLYQPAYLEGGFVQTLDVSLRAELQKYGVRNSHHNTIAPTGTISLLANNVSNGIEPIFQGEYDRHVREASGETITFTVRDYALQLWRKEKHESMPPAWVDTSSLSPDAHLQIQSAVQSYIDNAISKTINLPEHFPFASLSDVYTQAYTMQLKGCTIFRPNPVTGSVLVRKTESPPSEPCCQFDE